MWVYTWTKPVILPKTLCLVCWHIMGLLSKVHPEDFSCWGPREAAWAHSLKKGLKLPTISLSQMISPLLSSLFFAKRILKGLIRGTRETWPEEAKASTLPWEGNEPSKNWAAFCSLFPSQRLSITGVARWDLLRKNLRLNCYMTEMCPNIGLWLINLSPHSPNVKVRL